MSPSALPYVLLTGLLFGSSLIVSRYAVGQMEPTTFVWLRLALSSAAFVVAYTISAARRGPRRPPRGRTLWRDGVLLGIFSTAVPMVGTISSLRYLSAGLSALLLTISPAVVVLLAHFMLPDERLTSRKAAGIGLALAGAALLVLRGESGLPGVAGSPIGYALALGAILSDSLMIIYIRRRCTDHDTFDLSAARTLVGVLVVASLSLLFVGFDLSAVTRAGAAGLFYSAASSSFGGLMLFLWVNQRFGATSASLSSYVIPVVAAVGGVLLLGERITPVMATGTALIVGGIVALNRPEAAGDQ